MPCLLRVFFTTVILAASSISLADEWAPLFDGKDLSKWEAVENKFENWKVDDGILYCADGGGWLASKEEFSNFEIELEFKVYEGANSGVFLRAPLQGNPAWQGLEVQILDDDAPQYATLQPYQYCGGLYGCDAPATRAFTKVGAWQKYRIVANGRNIKVWLNDIPIIDSDLDKHKDKLKEHPGIESAKGRVGLQSHGGRVDFRNVRIKQL